MSIQSKIKEYLLENHPKKELLNAVFEEKDVISNAMVNCLNSFNESLETQKNGKTLSESCFKYNQFSSSDIFSIELNDCFKLLMVIDNNINNQSKNEFWLSLMLVEINKDKNINKVHESIGVSHYCKKQMCHFDAISQFFTKAEKTKRGKSIVDEFQTFFGKVSDCLEDNNQEFDASKLSMSFLGSVFEPKSHGQLISLDLPVGRFFSSRYLSLNLEIHEDGSIKLDLPRDFASKFSEFLSSHLQIAIEKAEQKLLDLGYANGIMDLILLQTGSMIWVSPNKQFSQDSMVWSLILEKAIEDLNGLIMNQIRQSSNSTFYGEVWGCC